MVPGMGPLRGPLESEAATSGGRETMTHLVNGPGPHGKPLCGAKMQVGDLPTYHIQRCTCSGCQLRSMELDRNTTAISTDKRTGQFTGESLE